MTNEDFYWLFKDEKLWDIFVKENGKCIKADFLCGVSYPDKQYLNLAYKGCIKPITQDKLVILPAKGIEMLWLIRSILENEKC